MERFSNWMEKNSHIILSVFICIQCFISSCFLILFFVEDTNEYSILVKIYSSLLLIIFTVLMVHFAYHSINRAYVIELIGFLLMSTIATILLVYFYVKYVLIFFKETTAIYSFGIIFIVISAIGNIAYFITAYYCYQHFDEIAMDKLGTKLVYHQMFKWNQFQHSTIKVDAGLIAVFVSTCLCFGISNVIYPIIDISLLIYSIVNILLMKYYLRYENKIGVVIALIIRSVVEGYIVFRCGQLFSYLEGNSENEKFFTDGYGKPITFTLIILNGVILLIEIVTSIKCISNFGKGLRDMIIKQKRNSITNANDTMDTEESI